MAAVPLVGRVGVGHRKGQHAVDDLGRAVQDDLVVRMGHDAAQVAAGDERIVQQLGLGFQHRGGLRDIQFAVLYQNDRQAAVPVALVDRAQRLDRQHPGRNVLLLRDVKETGAARINDVVEHVPQNETVERGADGVQLAAGGDGAGDAERAHPAQGVAVAVGDVLAVVEQRAVQIGGDQVKIGHGAVSFRTFGWIISHSFL